MPKSTQTRSQSAKRSRRKGVRAELYLAKLFSDTTQFRFRRTPGSGAWDRKEFIGDIACMDKDIVFPYVIESRNREGWNLVQLFEKTGELFNWWDDVVRDANAVQKTPVLIITKNNFPYLVLGRRRDFFSKTATRRPDTFLQVKIDDDVVWVMPLMYFLQKLAHWAHIVRICQETSES